MEFWSEETIENFRRTLLDWYDREGRATLPWRVDHDPYRVMVSEIMLQQTQVDTVLPYYERFMQALPTVQDLARAPEAQVLKLWEGLGYYSRVRNLQKAARFVVDDLHGHWPESADDLQVLPGVGPYTSAAIASISFGEVVPAVDGNAYRVFSRLLKIDADIAQPKSRKIFYDAILPIVDPDRPGDFNQAIMDLGSSYMTAKNPNSADSPVRAFNAAYRDGVEMAYPVKTKSRSQLSNCIWQLFQKKMGVCFLKNGQILVCYRAFGLSRWKKFKILSNLSVNSYILNPLCTSLHIAGGKFGL